MSQRLTPGECIELMASDVWLIDLREPADFAEAHPPGGVNVPFDERHLAERIATVVGDGPRLLLHASDAATLEAAKIQCERAQLELAGASSAGPQDWREAGAAWIGLPTLSTHDLDADSESRAQHVLDVREPMEWAVGHVPGAQLISLGQVRDRLSEIPTDRDVAVICEAGVRSSSAASLLQAAGFGRVLNVIDGSRGWRANQRPVQITEERIAHVEDEAHAKATNPEEGRT